MKDATKNIFQRVGRVVYCKMEEDGNREPLKNMIASQSGERIDQAKFRMLLFLNLINFQKDMGKYARIADKFCAVDQIEADLEEEFDALRRE